jgi:DNA-directed RNA polymerase subunit RPC12/RpoP
MTIETGTTIEFRDIHELEIECVACHTRVMWKPLQDQTFIPTECGKCGEQFLVKDSVEQKELLQLIATMTRHSFGGNSYILRFAVENGVKNTK